MESNEKPSVLIVDDNSKNLRILAEMLDSREYKIAMAKTGAKALKFIHKKKPDIVLLDIMMPEMDGFEVCRKLKGDTETREIPVIFISALVGTDDKLKGFDIGGVDYITKPFRKEEVLARVNAHLTLQHTCKILKKRNRRLKSAIDTKDRLLEIIAHDLRGSMGLITGELEMMAETPELFSDEKMKKRLTDELAITASSTRDLLDNLLAWAKTQRGEIRCRPRDTDIGRIVETNIRDMSGIAKSKGIRLRSELESPIFVHVDTDMIMTVVRNLVSNALKFTSESGEVVVGATVSKNNVEVFVSDTGMGIKPENMNRLFRVDRRFTEYGTRNEKGCGLGLLLCKDFVEKHNGAIRVVSEKGKGSTFKFTLPL